MKKMIQRVCLLVILALSTQYTDAQTTVQRSKAAKWTSDKGFWVVETNVKTPKQSVVLFYTNGGQLVYSEAVNGKRLNTRKKKTLVQLKNALDQVVYAYEKEGKAPTGAPLLAMLQRQ